MFCSNLFFCFQIYFDFTEVKEEVKNGDDEEVGDEKVKEEVEV